ncbi:hypothetical protein F6X40_21800 [Paraburkholderia sp. UCT31]|uniref:hypothetical protein n=1 Tax=Paraburkholderia sp. UCT31 TaxID=2615209 RepID=UPI0016555DA6|nr:hypothetical protein [Paraburkholderia sp. UCT31]MBC8739380.1 hypothetical protein [Paraburkholderia sp. UCT31]
MLDGNAGYSERAATDGKIKVLVIRDPRGKGTPYISLRFPDNLLDRYDALPGVGRTVVEDRIVTVVRKLLPDYESQFKSGVLLAHEPYPIEFDDQLVDGI